MQKFSKKEALKYAWEKFKEHKWFWLGIEVIIFGILTVLNLLVEEVGNSAIIFVFDILIILIEALVSMGIIFVCLKVYDGLKPYGADILRPTEQFLNYFGASVLYALVVVGGFLLLIVPGVIWAIKYGFYGYLVVDKKVGPFEAMSLSGKITEGEKWNLFWFGIVLGLLNVGGALLFGVGLLISMPMSWLAAAYVYRRLLQHSN